MEHKRADLLGADPYPGETPQAESDREQTQESWKPDYTVAPARPVDSYNWSMSGTHIAVSNDDHGTQFAAMQWGDFSRPYAYGKVEVQYGWTTHWHVYYTNMSFHILEKRLKKFTRDQGWDWGGILDNEGTPVDYRSLKSASVPGIGEINPGLIDYENNDWSGMQEYDNPGDHQSDTPFYGFSDYDEDFPMTGPRTCTECGAPLLDYNDWRKHVLRYHVNEDRKPPGDPQPVVDLDDVLPAGFNEAVMDKTVQRQSRLIFQLTAEKPRNFIREAMTPKLTPSNEPCYLESQWLAWKHPEQFEYQAGQYHHPTLGPQAHAWVRKPDGTIVDVTHGQFEPDVPLAIVPQTDPLYARYRSWNDYPDMPVDFENYPEGFLKDRNDPLHWLFRGRPGHPQQGPKPDRYFKYSRTAGLDDIINDAAMPDDWFYQRKKRKYQIGQQVWTDSFGGFPGRVVRVTWDNGEPAYYVQDEKKPGVSPILFHEHELQPYEETTMPEDWRTAANWPQIPGPMPSSGVVGQKIWCVSSDGQHLEEWEWLDG